MIAKDEAAQTLIDWHFRIDEELTEIYRFLAPDEDAHGGGYSLFQYHCFGVASRNDADKRRQNTTSNEMELR